MYSFYTHHLSSYRHGARKEEAEDEAEVGIQLISPGPASPTSACCLFATPDIPRNHLLLFTTVLSVTTSITEMPDSPPEHPHISVRAHGTHVITALLLLPDLIITASDDTTILLSSPLTGAPIHCLTGHTGAVWSLALHTPYLISGSTDKTLRIWNLETYECISVLRGHTNTVRSVALTSTPEGTVIVSGSRDSTIKIWRFPSEHAGELLRTLEGHTNSVRDIDVHGDVLVSGSYDSTVCVWSVATGETRHVLRGHGAKVYAVKLDGKRGRCVSAGMDCDVRIWDLDSGECLYTLKGHTSLVGLLAVDEEVLVSCAADARICIWDPRDGRLMNDLRIHTGAITCFHLLGGKIVSGSDRRLILWDMQKGGEDRDLLTGLAGVWQVKFDRRRCVAAVQRDHLTYIEVLEWDDLPERMTDLHIGDNKTAA